MTRRRRGTMQGYTSPRCSRATRAGISTYGCVNTSVSIAGGVKIKNTARKFAASAIQQNELIKTREGCFGECGDAARHSLTHSVPNCVDFLLATLALMIWLARKKERESYLRDDSFVTVTPQGSLD